MSQKVFRWSLAFVLGLVVFVLLADVMWLAIPASLLVFIYFAWVAFMATRKEVHRFLPDEVELDRTRQHPVMRALAAFLSLPGWLVLGVALVMWLQDVGIHWSFKLPPPPRTGKSGSFKHQKHTAEFVRHVDFPLWWVPLLIAILLLLFACYIWQDWKHTTYLTTDRRTIVNREAIPYMPWLQPKFEQTPYHQIVDIDDRRSTLGNWGSIALTKRLHKVSDSEMQILTYRIIPDSQRRADLLRTALEEFRTQKKKKPKKPSIVTIPESQQPIEE